MKIRMLGVVIALVCVAMLSGTVFAQYSDPWYTSYQVVNVGTGPANIVVSYYDSAGNEVVAAQRTFSAVPAGGSKLVLQYDETALGTGAFSAVIQADQPIVAITNQQLNPASAGKWVGNPPYSTYSGEAEGSFNVTLPAVMYNWYNYYTEMYVMNVGTGSALLDISYVPGAMDVGSGSEPTGRTGQTQLDLPIPQFASKLVSQESMTNLGATSGTFTGRFLGSAVLTADQPIVAVVNQHNVASKKLMTYNGFAGGALKIAAPSYMRGYYGYYTTLLIANPSTTQTANVTLTYVPDTSNPVYNAPAPGSSIGTVTVNHSIPPQKALTRYDGYGATDGQSDLDDDVHAYTRFFGSVKVDSNIDVMVQVNVEAKSGATEAAQAGSYNGIPYNAGTNDLVAPVILADFYGYYTTMIVQNVDTTAGTCNISYTSDDTYSAVKSHTETYSHAIPLNGSFTVYEGRAGGQEVGDINSDAAWRSGGNQQFIGAATLDCTVKVVAFINEEKNVNGFDSMYTMNAFNMQP
jgi:hypothetical protein